MNEYIQHAQDHNEKALVALQKDFAKLRTGRANAAVLEGITVNYYGAPTPITQVAAIKCPEAHMLTIEPWDKSIVNAVEKAIMASDLGVTPSNDGCGLIRLPFVGGLIGVDRELFPTYDAGAFRAGNTTMIVSRGLGNSVPIPRLFNGPELPVITLERERST